MATAVDLYRLWGSLPYLACFIRDEDGIPKWFRCKKWNETHVGEFRHTVVVVDLSTTPTCSCGVKFSIATESSQGMCPSCGTLVQAPAIPFHKLAPENCALVGLPVTFPVGSRVYALYLSSDGLPTDQFYPATVLNDEGNLITVRFDDGDDDQSLERTWVIPGNPREWKIQSY